MVKTDEAIITLHCTPSNSMIADLLTKPLFDNVAVLLLLLYYYYLLILCWNIGSKSDKFVIYL